MPFVSVSTTSVLLATCPRKLKFLENQIISSMCEKGNEVEKVNPAALTGAKVGLTGAQQTFYYFCVLNVFKQPLDFLKN